MSISSSTSLVYLIEVFLADVILSDWLLSPFFGLRPVFRALPVTRHLQNPDHFIVQLFSYALKKIWASYYTQFPPIRAQKSERLKKPVFMVQKRKKT